MVTASTEITGAGVDLDSHKNELRIDLNRPRTITVHAVNEFLRIDKTYILRITSKGVCLI